RLVQANLFSMNHYSLSLIQEEMQKPAKKQPARIYAWNLVRPRTIQLPIRPTGLFPEAITTHPYEPIRFVVSLNAHAHPDASHRPSIPTFHDFSSRPKTFTSMI